ncbi:hypothetical protein BN1200_540041 [Klebsiella variicola]|nr:hypothetical protein BN1200_540041 [Klebsiella variicola]
MASKFCSKVAMVYVTYRIFLMSSSKHLRIILHGFAMEKLTLGADMQCIGINQQLKLF